jgi:hypothetical protein
MEPEHRGLLEAGISITAFRQRENSDRGSNRVPPEYKSIILTPHHLSVWGRLENERL